MINLGTDKIKDIYMGIDGISKVYLGTDLIWEKVTFKDVNIAGFGEVTINDGGEYQLPLNVSLRYVVNMPLPNGLIIKSKWGSEKYDVTINTSFIIKTNEPIVIIGKGMWDVTFKASDKEPYYVIE